MKKALTAGALLIAALLVAPTSYAAETRTANYLAPGGANPGVSGYLDVDSLVPEAGGDIGGARFAAEGLTPVKVDIADAGGRAVGYTVAQDFNNNNLSGESGEPRVAGCGKTVTLGASAVPFSPDHATVVFIVENPTCAGIATSGTITLTLE